MLAQLTYLVHLLRFERADAATRRNAKLLALLMIFEAFDAIPL